MATVVIKGRVRSVRRGWVYGKGTEPRLTPLQCVARACTHKGTKLTTVHVLGACINAFALHTGLPVELYPLFVQATAIPSYFITLKLAGD